MLGGMARGFLPEGLARKVPKVTAAGTWPPARHARRMLILRGCVQPTLAPSIDAAMARVLDRIGISAETVAGGGCCGALPYHLNEQDEGRTVARRNIDAWWPAIERGAEAVIVTASGCGVMVKDYGHLLARRSRLREEGRARRRARPRSGRGRGRRVEGDRARRWRWIAAACASRSIRRARCSTA